MANGETSHFDATASSPQPTAEQKAQQLEDQLMKDQAAEVDETLEAVNQQKGDLVGQVEKTLDIKKFGAEKLKSYLDFRIGKIGNFLTTKIQEINSATETDKIKKINTHILGFDFKSPNKLPNHFANTFPVLEKNISSALQTASAEDKPKFQEQLTRVKNLTQIFGAKKIENITQANDTLTKLQPILNQILTPVSTDAATGVAAGENGDSGVEQEFQTLNGLQISQITLEKFGDSNITFRTQGQKIGTDKIGLFLTNSNPAIKFQNGSQTKSLGLMEENGQAEADSAFLIKSSDYVKIDFDGKKLILTKKDNSSETWNIVDSSVDSSATSGTQTAGATNTGTSDVQTQVDSGEKEKIGSYDIPKAMIDSLKGKGISLVAENSKDFGDSDIGLKLNYGTSPNFEFSILDSDGTTINNIRSDLMDDGKNPIVGLPKNATDITFDTNTQVTDLAGYYQLNIHYKQDGKDFSLMITPNSETLDDTDDTSTAASDTTDATASETSLT